MNAKHNRDWLIERAVLGEAEQTLTEEERARAQVLAAENEKILAALPPARVAEEVHRRARVAEVSAESAADRARRPGWRWMALAAPLAAGALALALVTVEPPPHSVDPGIEITRVKGPRKLSIHRKGPGGLQELHAGDTIQRGDLLQLAFSPGSPTYGLVLSIDGGGAVTLHFPRQEQGRSPALDTQGAGLPNSYELDAAPDFERFFLITADEPFAAEVAVKAARELVRDSRRAQNAELPLPSELAQTSVLLRKVVAP